MIDVEACDAEVHISLVTVWCLMLPLTFRCNLRFSLWFCLVVWGFFSVAYCAHYILAPSSLYLSINSYKYNAIYNIYIYINSDR